MLLPAPFRRALRSARRTVSWAVMRPESERLHDFLTAQLMESHQFTARALADLQLAVDRIAERAGTVGDSSSALAYRALAGLPAGAAVLELIEHRVPLRPVLIELGYQVASVPAHLAAAHQLEADIYDAILDLEGAAAGPLLDGLTSAAKPGATLVLGHRRGEKPDLGGWAISNEWEVPGSRGARLVTATRK